MCCCEKDASISFAYSEKTGFNLLEAIFNKGTWGYDEKSFAKLL
jgi:hypothetical protein